jgi:hypothetical protein
MIVGNRVVDKDLIVSEDTIDDCIDKQAGLIAFYGEAWAKAEREVRVKRLEREKIYAIKENKIRSTFAEKLTEGIIKAKITVDPIYQDAEEKYINAKFEYNKLNVIMNALDNKRDALKLKMQRIRMDWSPEVSQRDLEKDSNVMRKEKSDSIQKSLKTIKLKRS